MPKLVYLVTEDWYFLSHRLPMARAAAAAGFEVHVITRVGEGAQQIEAEGFRLHPINWRRQDASLAHNLTATKEIRARLLGIGADIVHNVALKPTLAGTLACLGMRQTAVINSINGFGSSYLAAGNFAQIRRTALQQALRRLIDREGVTTIVQNSDDFAALSGLGVNVRRLRLIPGSGVDTERLVPASEPTTPPFVATYVGRLLADKGIRTLVESHRRLREQGMPIETVLAGQPDSENPTSIPASEIEDWKRIPGLLVAGQVTDIGGLWARSHVAVLPSRREGLPLSLLEASACGRPMIASDVPGCREIVVPEVTGLLVPLDDPNALGRALMTMAADPALRIRMGMAARERAEGRYSTRLITEAIQKLYFDAYRLASGERG
jgi:glycosyltransferase involved in cell wall biosynthesis